MKTFKLRYLTLVLVFFNFALLAQVPNAGFESWTGSSPDNWMPSYPTAISKSTDAHSGSAAVKGEVISLFGVLMPPQVICGTPGGQGFTVTNRPKTFTMWYKHNSVQGDVFFVNVVLYNGSNAVGGAAGIFNATSAYTKISIDFTYMEGGAVPDNAYIQLGITADQGSSAIHQGSYFIADDVAFEGTATDVKTDKTIPSKFELKQNHPNPFNPSTLIEYSVAEKSSVRLSVYNITGQKVADLVNQTQEAGNYTVTFNAKDMTTGVYFYKLEAGSFTSTRKMILTK